jgi:hypothetical protein
MVNVAAAEIRLQRSSIIPSNTSARFMHRLRSRRIAVWCVCGSGVALAIGLTLANTNEHCEDP